MDDRDCFLRILLSGIDLGVLLVRGGRSVGRTVEHGEVLPQIDVNGLASEELGLPTRPASPLVGDPRALRPGVRRRQGRR